MDPFVPVTYNIPFVYLGDELRRIFFQELAVNGVKHIVLGAGLLPQLMMRPELPEKIAAEMESAGLTFADAHAPFGSHWDLSSPFGAELPLRLSRTRLVMELARFFDVRTITIHLGKRDPGMSSEQYFSLICRSFDELLPLAEEKKLTLCIENGFAYRGFPQTLLDVKERFPQDTLGFCFDAGHANIMTAPETFQQTVRCPSYEEILDAMLPHIVTCHIHDNDGSCDKHDLPGRGCVDWEKVCAKLRKAPRLQVFQSEVHIPANGVAVRELVETFEKFFGKNTFDISER